MSASAAPELTLKDFQVGQATIGSAELSGHIGVDTGATIEYQEGRGFELTWWFPPDPTGPPTRVRQLDEQDLRVLSEKIRTALAAPPASLDVSALEAFGDLVAGYVGHGGNLFEQVRFGQAVEEIFGGVTTVIGHIGLGVDVAGTIHEVGGVVTWEHHIVPLPPGPFRPLTVSERDSLRDALTVWLEGRHDAGWEQILAAIEG